MNAMDQPADGLAMGAVTRVLDLALGIASPALGLAADHPASTRSSS